MNIILFSAYSRLIKFATHSPYLQNLNLKSFTDLLREYINPQDLLIHLKQKISEKKPIMGRFKHQQSTEKNEKHVNRLAVLLLRRQEN